AFSKAAAEDKPVFLSIGYSACHWCHVMARESFENADIAALLNEGFVCVKVDREERPDIDEVYMVACQALGGAGGWPLNLFLTPEGKPFFAGTYFPPESRYGRPGFKQLVQAVKRAWSEQRETLLGDAEAAAAFIREAQAHTPGPGERPPEARELIWRALAWFERHYDAEAGGFGEAPKFPMGHQLLFLLELHDAAGKPEALAMAEHTLAQMYKGGLFDHIGHGFCRYSTDRRFLVPHFEKMLYDNALLILAYGRAHTLTQKPFYARAARQCADYVLREMQGAEGGFFSAQDADSGGREGAYYVLSYDEVLAALGEARGKAFCAHYGITPRGNFEAGSIPNLLHDPSDRENWETCRRILYDWRKRRRPLKVDDKMLAGWNGLMIAALAQLGRTLGEARYLDAARRAERCVEARLMEQGTLYASFRAGRRGAPGFLEDYAFYGLGLIALHDATLEPAYLKRAAALTEAALERFQDKARGGFFLSGRDGERLIANPKPVYDGALPSGNSAMALVFQALALRTGEAVWEARARAQLDFMSALIEKRPAGHSFFLLALLLNEFPPARIVCVPAPDAGRTRSARQLPPRAAIRVPEPSSGAYPLINGQTTYYICSGQSCLPPVNSLENAAL
ncbi:MAG: thioredoxin domain-containing protein, partial [Clostridia bacterium]|nr:thioredoxin domain-containing protein [Clostridia bacterium]